MSVFNCHVNRAPVSGRLGDYAYVRGQKMAAFAEKASTENEQNRITLVAAPGSITFKQIAGALARRIVFYPQVGDAARARPADRPDQVRLPRRPLRARRRGGPGQPGDKLKAGRTAIARWPKGA